MTVGETAPCPGCGSRHINGAGKCSYCLTQRAVNHNHVENSAAIDDAELDHNVHNLEVVRLRKELGFFEEQYQFTDHKSLPIKIERLKLKIQELTNREKHK